MTTADIDRWEPLTVDEAADLFRDAPFRWWTAGGYALELHTARSWRTHADIDISICGSDTGPLRSYLAEWDIYVAADGVLTPWDGQLLDPAKHQNNLWCRETTDGPWRFDVPVGDGDATEWIYRRDRKIRLPWNEAVISAPNGVPYLTPELALLFKSKNLRAKDTLDARETIPTLGLVHLRRLKLLQNADHHWQRLLADIKLRANRTREGPT